MEALFRQQNRCLIGHNRYATQGAVNSVNAHPFDFEHIIGAHNGSLRSTLNLPDHKDFVVDSENIFHAINQDGSVETAAKLNGAYALTWWDKRDNTLHFLRNAERPLWYVFTQDRQAIFWASELWMLTGVLARNNIKHTEPVSTETHKEYTFQIPMNGQPQIGTIRVEERDFYSAPVTSYSGYQGSSWGNSYSRGSASRSYSGGVVGGGSTNSGTVGTLPAKKNQPLTLVVGGKTVNVDHSVQAALLRLKLRKLSEEKLMASSSTKTIVTH